MQNQSTAPVSIIESRAEAYQRQLGISQSEKRTPTMFLVFMFSILVIIGTAVAMVFLAEQQPDNENIAEDGAVDLAGYSDAVNQTEELNAHLTALLKGEPHSDYVSNTELSKYSNMSPEEIARDFGLKIDDGKIEIIGDNYTTLWAMNSNILNYYLDNGQIAVIYAKGGYPFTTEGKTIIVYGGRPVDALYYTYPYTENSYGYKYDIVTKLELFESMTRAEEFKVLTPLETEAN
ncbi:hypothetical protein IJ765_00440 [Candidatus Saccharibacteria bacterium]|nr:hypothetical protein [Candidatus Saccharibacteria bacterium]